MNTAHRSVLYKEVLEALGVKPGKTYIDATLNGGGHTKGILELGGAVLGIDVDPQAIENAARLFGLHPEKRSGLLIAQKEGFTAVQGNFANITQIASNFGVWETSGVLFDLGLSSLQLEEGKRGFSFKRNEPLDMRMDPALAVTAADLVNNFSERELYELFFKFGEEHASRRIARAIVQSRVKEKITTSTQLAGIIERAVGRRGKIHPATRVFQALRIAVNNEIANLEKGLEGSVGLLEKGGRLVVISFHSLEDRVVKTFFRERNELQVLTKKPIVPAREEIVENPRSRSAKMRIVEKQ
ncbi:MAG: 16S rRNA (cytosine(1402)-N(4))-methyltransferase RsmH [bacterium]|nr:16S rRNA (cytosine(1402)-N(4))-methyltransferase RsmH [bacterium]